MSIGRPVWTDTERAQYVRELKRMRGYEWNAILVVAGGVGFFLLVVLAIIQQMY